MRSYREDGERIVKVGGIYVRRPHAVPQEAISWREVAGLTLFLLFMYATIFYALPVVVEGLTHVQ